LAKQVQIKKSDIPEGWSLEAADFINRLIQRKPVNRLGLNGPNEVKDHLWIKNFPWDKLIHKEMQAPFLVNVQQQKKIKKFYLVYVKFLDEGGQFRIKKN
jgi:hypothetical protein